MGYSTSKLRCDALNRETQGSFAGVAVQIIASLEMRTREQTCDGWPNGLTGRFNLQVQPCARARTKENSTETNLRQLALGGQTVKICVHFRQI